MSIELEVKEMKFGEEDCELVKDEDIIPIEDVSTEYDHNERIQELKKRLTLIPEYIFDMESLQIQHLMVFASFNITFFDIQRNCVIFSYNFEENEICEEEMSVGHDFSIESYPYVNEGNRNEREKRIVVVQLFMECQPNRFFKRFYHLYFHVDLKANFIQLIGKFIKNSNEERFFKIRENRNFTCLCRLPKSLEKRESVDQDSNFNHQTTCEIQVFSRDLHDQLEGSSENKLVIFKQEKIIKIPNVLQWISEDDKINGNLFESVIDEDRYLFTITTNEKQLNFQMINLKEEKASSSFSIKLRDDDYSRSMGSKPFQIDNMKAKNLGRGVILLQVNSKSFYHVQYNNRNHIIRYFRTPCRIRLTSFFSNRHLVIPNDEFFELRDIDDEHPCIVKRYPIPSYRDMSYMNKTICYEKKKVMMFYGKKGLIKVLSLDKKKKNTNSCRNYRIGRLKDKDWMEVHRKNVAFAKERRQLLYDQKTNMNIDDYDIPMDLSTFHMIGFGKHSVILYHCGSEYSRDPAEGKFLMYRVDFGRSSSVKKIMEIRSGKEYKHMGFTQTTHGFNVRKIDMATVLVDGKYLIRVNGYKEFFFFMVWIWQKIQLPKEILTFHVLSFVNPNSVSVGIW